MPKVGFPDMSFGGVGVWTLVLMLLVALIKAWPALAKLRLEGDTSLRSDLWKRIEKLEEDQRLQKIECAAEQLRLNTQLQEKEKSIQGLQRQLMALQMSLVGGIPLHQQSPEMRAVAERLLPILFPPEEEQDDVEG